MNTIFIVGIGGTGMKCLESFVHLCAMGMFDNHEVHILALDTDIQNGNFAQLQKIIKYYNDVKGVNKTTTTNSFFTAKINLYSFSPNYSTDDTNTFQNITGLTTSLDTTTADLANAFFTKDVQQFNLLHGYRAQTHIGSMLMYHALVEAGKDTQSDLYKFVNHLNLSINHNPRVFVMGSVFGGTGASSIPILPLALNEICRVNYTTTLEQARFGAILLTHYFTFNGASDGKKKAEKVIADAANFAINSQAALMFYEKDNTVKNTYKRFYTLGIEGNKTRVSVSKTETEPITGGASQKNDAHYIELVAAGAAYDFVTSDNDNSYNVMSANEPFYLYREMDSNTKLEFKDIINNDEFVKKCTLMTAMSFLVNLDVTDFFRAAQMNQLVREEIQGYDAITAEQVASLKHYFSFFHFKVDNGQIGNGWLRNIHKSVGGNNNLFFAANMYVDTLDRLNKFEFQEIFSDKAYIKHNFKGGRIFTGNSKDAFDKFKGTFKSKGEDGSVQNPAERLVKRMYDTLNELYSF
jgi:hypothetical protein